MCTQDGEISAAEYQRSHSRERESVADERANDELNVAQPLLRDIFDQFLTSRFHYGGAGPEAYARGTVFGV